ncbi:hypothetical protein Dsin_001848 [Dipteronia sinensis]|uniref:DUF4283 domain-containing protein n=1 Tax=Dipteronia sinensis TaxID=43782 RepID=A0AAE0B519_9ROSI|nr:hypothetical protein Dsin_001848 [Dipteronia sinensis]
MLIWGNRGLLEVLANEKGFYFFKFSDDEACSNVLEAGPWLSAGRMMILKKWHPRLILSKDFYSKIPVWVKLFNIPHEYWNEEGLSHIASAVDFLPLVDRCSREQVHGTMQYKLCSKLRNMKKVLKTLNNDKVGDLTIKSIEAKATLDDCQRLLDQQPLDSNLRI